MHWPTIGAPSIDVARARWRLVKVGERRAALARGAEVAARLERVGHVGGLEVVALLLLGLVAAVLRKVMSAQLYAYMEDPTHA